jgi:hypothetical protein
MSNANKHQKDEDHLSKYSHDECFNLQSWIFVSNHMFLHLFSDTSKYTNFASNFRNFNFKCMGKNTKFK